MAIPAPPFPDVLDRYRLIEKIGGGGTGEVFRAHDQHLERDVALKILRQGTLADEIARKRFRNEALTLSRISHPNIAIIYDFGTERGLDFLVTELVRGEPLNEKLRHELFTETEALRIAAQLLEGLQAAHREGILHRDLKPGNLMLTGEGRVKILDFGLAISIPQIGDATTTDSSERVRLLAGTLAYMSPEQLRDDPLDARSDVYSVGVVLYELLTGHRPFEHSVATLLADAILHQRAVPPGDLRSGLTSATEQLILKCLEKEPAERYDSAQELLAGINRVLASPAARKLIAVPYFENLSRQAEDEYFRDGITEDITTELSKITELRVLSRSAVLPYRDKPVPAMHIGRQLGASHVLEGSIRRERNRLRITAKLVDARTGQTNWAERFDRGIEDVFAIQDEIAHNIARTLRLMLTDTEKRAIEKVPTADVEAYDLYLRGRQFFHQFRRRGYDFARQTFARAIELDPSYARAYAGIADCSSFLFMYWDSSQDNLQQADEASKRALELDPELAEAHASRGLAAYLKKQYDEAQREFEIAMQLRPSLLEPYYFSARSYYGQGRLEEAAKWFEKASNVQPDDYQSPMLLASTLNGLGRKTEALSAYRRGLIACDRHLAVHPGDSRALYFGANALAQLGERKRAREWLARAIELEPDEPQVLYNVACVYALLGESEKAIDCLESSITRGWEQREWMAHDPDLTTLRGNPRFQALIAKPESAKPESKSEAQE